MSYLKDRLVRSHNNVFSFQRLN